MRAALLGAALMLSACATFTVVGGPTPPPGPSPTPSVTATPPQGAISRVQHVSGALGAQGTSLDLNLPGLTLGSSLVIVAVSWGPSAATVQVSDTKNDLYQPAAQGTDSLGDHLFLFYAPGVAQGVGKITIRTSNAVSIVGAAAEYSGVGTSMPFQGAQSGMGTSGLPDSGPLALALTGGLVFAALLHDTPPNTAAAGGGFFLIDDQTGGGLADADQLYNTSLIVHATFTLSAPVPWTCIAAGFR